MLDGALDGVRHYTAQGAAPNIVAGVVGVAFREGNASGTPGAQVALLEEFDAAELVLLVSNDVSTVLAFQISTIA